MTVGLEPFAREGGEDSAAADHEVGGLVAAGDGEQTGKFRHCRENVLGFAAWTS